MPAFTVLIFDERFDAYDEEAAVLSAVDAEVVNIRRPAVECDPEVVTAADAVLVNLLPMDSANIAALGSRCRVISRYGVGVDNVDVEAATAAGIWCSNVRGYASDSVSDHALALLLDCIRGVTRRDRQVRNGTWNTSKSIRSYQIAGKTLGLVGLGSIGSALCRKVRALRLARILVYDPYQTDDAIREAGAQRTTLDDLVTVSDFISIHAPLTDETRAIIGAEQFAAMKPTAILINTSRGPLVDEEALAKALQVGSIASAGIDVYATEPLIDKSPLRDLDNIVMTDHVGWYSEESIVELKKRCAENVLEVLKGNPPVFPVNQIKPA